ncbi:MAG: hypothetical protein Roseis2KO_44650 [Roseivirga sp.]
MKKLIPTALLVLITLSVSAQDFRVINDLSYYESKETNDKQKLDLYLPEGIEEPPMLIWIHGGAWAFGNRKNEKALAEKFVAKGIAVAAISYRLSPGTWADPKFDKGIQHPEHIKDVARAFSWVYNHADEYGYSQQDLFVSGYSAGGHLAALLATDPRYLKAQGLAFTDIKAVIPIAGAYDIAAYHDTHYQYNGPEMAEKHVKAVFGSSKPELADASPTSYIDNLTVPMLLISENQSYRYTKIFEDALKKVGKDRVEYLHVRELNHKEFYQDLAETERSKYRNQIIEFIFRHGSREP